MRASQGKDDPGHDPPQWRTPAENPNCNSTGKGQSSPKQGLPPTGCRVTMSRIRLRSQKSTIAGNSRPRLFSRTKLDNGLLKYIAEVRSAGQAEAAVPT